MAQLDLFVRIQAGIYDIGSANHIHLLQQLGILGRIRHQTGTMKDVGYTLQGFPQQGNIQNIALHPLYLVSLRDSRHLATV
ncbi:hypothetical protein GCM10011323_20880 [Pontibacter amylolyticus]|uniref:Uncharacterized protein n=1 Tax=Pontibacter amylolyticus TaxID=1424080 RepID=A0ABQ1W6L2_9BACT|nr:hypothetical protein GCM10011323_20880 [Pontibacter amylolyticus]